jgi:hypothetical protein
MRQTTVISGVDRIVNLDGTNHLNCRLQQVLAFTASRTRWADLLMYAALGSTFPIYRHCYARRKDRWSFIPPYLGVEDLRLLGVDLTPVAEAEAGDLDRILDRTLAGDQPLIFFAPRVDFPHWITFMREMGTVEEDFDNLHSFMIAGANGDRSELLLIDNARPDHHFFPLVVPRPVMAAGYAREPERWFLDGATITVAAGPPEPDLPTLAARYRALVAAHRAEIELYDQIGDGLLAERTEYRETYRAPSVNALALLAGSRDFFTRFLRHTGHSRPVRAAYSQNARLTRDALDRAGRHHAGDRTVDTDELRRDLHLLGRREARAARMLADDLAGMRVLLPRLGV